MAEAALGIALEQLWKVIKDLAARPSRFREQYQRLGKKLGMLIPILPGRPTNSEADALMRELQKGEELVSKCAKVAKWDLFKQEDYSRQLQVLEEAIQVLLQAATLRGVWELQALKEMNSKFDEFLRGGSELGEPLPPLPGNIFGIEKPLIELKGKLMKHQVVGVCGMGGCGKTTLVTKLCRELNGVNIFYFTVPSSSDTLTHVQDAVGRAADMISKENKQTIKCAEDGLIALIVLDDVWSEKYLKNLLFRTEGLKTIVISREKIKKDIDEIYPLPNLEGDAAKKLFYHAAGQPPSTFTSQAEQIIRGCGGLPLALQHLGGRLKGEPFERWEAIKNDMLNEGHIYTSEADLLSCFSKTIESLSPQQRECFIDMGSFLEVKRLPAASIIDMWVELYSLTEELAFLELFDLSKKHLLDLTRRTRSEVISGGNYNDLIVSQHNLLRDLALHYGNTTRRRLIINGKEGGESGSQNHQEIEALDDAETSGGARDSQLRDTNSNELHVSQGPVDIINLQGCEANNSGWGNRDFSGAKVLMLNFSAKTYQLPPLLWSMGNLKVLIITNHSFDQAKINRQPRMGWNTLTNLRRMRLERISVCGFFENEDPLSQHLEKLSLVFCDFSQSNSDSSAQNITAIFPELKQLEIHYALDLVHLPPVVCETRKLQKLSITKCPDLISLPQKMNQLTDLKYLNLYGCSSLEGLPDSICELKNLETLDLCDCSMIERLPENLGSLSCLAKIDMRHCFCLNELPKSVAQMSGLGLVMCDEGTKKLWDPLKEKNKAAALDKPQVLVIEEKISLEFLS